MNPLSAAGVDLALAGCATMAGQGGGRSLFNGSSLEGWSPKAVHGGRGGIWTVENGTSPPTRRLRARIVGQPARIDAWLNGVQTLAFTDTTARYPREGYIGLQVHGSEGAWGDSSRARFRNIRITPIE